MKNKKKIGNLRSLKMKMEITVAYVGYAAQAIFRSIYIIKLTADQHCSDCTEHDRSMTIMSDLASPHLLT